MVDIRNFLKPKTLVSILICLSSNFVINGCKKEYQTTSFSHTSDYYAHGNVLGNGRDDVVISDSTGIYYQTRLYDGSLGNPNYIVNSDHKLSFYLALREGSLPDVKVPLNEIYDEQGRYRGMNYLTSKNLGNGKFAEPETTSVPSHFDIIE